MTERDRADRFTWHEGDLKVVKAEDVVPIEDNDTAVIEQCDVGGITFTVAIRPEGDNKWSWRAWEGAFDERGKVYASGVQRGPKTAENALTAIKWQLFDMINAEVQNG